MDNLGKEITAPTRSGHNTQLLGTVGSVMKCLQIILYSKSNLPGTDKITIYNMPEVVSNLLAIGKYQRVTRDSAEVDFKVKSNSEGFNVIIYLTTTGPIGFTEFTSVQGRNRDIDIALSLTVFSTSIQVAVNNSLVQLRKSSNTIRDYTGDRPTDFVTAEKVKVRRGERGQVGGYTNRVGDLGDRSIYTPTLFVPTSSAVKKLSIPKSVNVDPKNKGLVKHQVGYVKRDLVMYSWSDFGDFTVYSISGLNQFGSLVSYSNTRDGYSTLPEGQVGYFAGRYVSLSGKLYNWFDRVWVNSDKGRLLVDSLDVDSRLIDLPTSIGSSNLSTYLPKFSNCYIDIDEFTKTNKVEVTKISGAWYSVNYRTVGGRQNQMWVSYDKIVHVEESDDVTPMNDSALLIKRLDGSYKLVVGSEREFYTTDTDDGSIEFRPGDTLSSSALIGYARQGVIQVGNVIPTIITASSGLLFYKRNDGLISYL